MQALTVRFWDVEEFLGEMEAEASHVDRGIVRVSIHRRPDRDGIYWAVAVTATCAAHGQVVRLEQRLGSAPPKSVEMVRLMQSGDAAARDLEASLHRLNLCTRPGTLEA